MKARFPRSLKGIDFGSVDWLNPRRLKVFFGPRNRSQTKTQIINSQLNLRPDCRHQETESVGGRAWLLAKSDEVPGKQPKAKSARGTSTRKVSEIPHDTLNVKEAFQREGRLKLRRKTASNNLRSLLIRRSHNVKS